MIAILVAAPDSEPGFSESVRKDVESLAEVIGNDAIFDAPKAITTLVDCKEPQQLFSELENIHKVSRCSEGIECVGGGQTSKEISSFRLILLCIFTRNTRMMRCGKYFFTFQATAIKKRRHCAWDRVISSNSFPQTACL
jgi:hypothetical protein